LTDQAAKVLNLQKLAASIERLQVLELVKTEIQAMRMLRDCPHAIKLHEVLEDQESDKVYLVIEYCSKGALLSNQFWKSEEAYQGMTKRENQYLACLQNHLPLEKVLKYMRSISAAIEYSITHSCSALRGKHHPPRHQA
jgi:serine/threonine protein kinase